MVRLAAEQGNAVAQFGLGVMFYRGEGMPQDYAEATKWNRLAAERGYPEAQFWLGAMYGKTGVSQNYTESAKWLRLAAEQGNTRAQIGLGMFYANGSGVQQDNVQAHKWFNLAAGFATTRESRQEAIKNRDLISARMTSEQIAEAQKLAREWKPKSSALGK